MGLTLKPKSFGPIYVSFDGTEHMRYALIDPEKTTSYPPYETPVDTMIASLGACIVKSIIWAANQRDVPLNPFCVKLMGIKSAEIPGRIETIDMAIMGQIVEDASLASRILKQAKAICTVSNSLNSDVNLTF
ncbi:MAG: OsmC family protein [Cohaesibacter sp.]|nr:OsmC family protein [Cohaesibacter sp.]